MKTKTTEYQFDFTLSINDKIICKRFFKDDNFKKKSIDFNEVIEIINVTTNSIKDFIKSESIELLWEKYRDKNQKLMFYVPPKNDIIKITLNYNSRFVASSFIDGSIYPPKVKYQIDIRPIIPVIISNISICLKD